eukprot:XP_782650.2 PREDICTED: RRP15-like protein [Strongylocentrotus purpuratus]
MSALMVNKRKMAHVKVSYDSGSDGDIESDEDVKTKTVLKRKMKTLPKKQLTTNEMDDESDEDIDDEEEEDDGDEEEEDEEEEDDGDEEEDDGDEEEEGEEIPGVGWADAMASILRKEAPEEGSAVLAKSKDYAKAKEEEMKDYMERIKEKQSRKKWENMSKVIPKVTDREFEKSLQRIATKGVVQLFNAVKKQQKTREDKLKKVGGSQRKRAKVEASLTKGNFLDMLKGTPAPSSVDPSSKAKGSITSTEKPLSGDQPSWGVLRDDFMLGAGMKDWDKEGSEEDDDDEKNDSGLSSDSD